MYPRNAASPERIAVGAVVQISDGAVQTSGVSIAVRGQGGSSGAGGGTTAYDNGIVEYTPIQGETDFTSFVVIAFKTGCIPVSQTIVTSASATPGYAGVDWGFVANKTTTNALTGTTIASTQKVDIETIKTNPVVNGGTITFPTTATLASTTNITAGTITTATNLTNAPTAGDFTATMKTSIGTAVAASAVASVTGNVGGNVTGSVGSVTGNVGGNVTGSVGSVVGAVGSVTGNVGGNVTGSVGSLAAQAKADVNAEVLDVLNVDTFAQPGQGTPAATTTIRLMLAYLYKAWRNRTTQTATEYDLFNDDATTVDQKATFADNGTTADRSEVATGP